MPSQIIKNRLVSYVELTVFLSVAACLSHGQYWHAGADLHSILEVTATMLAFFVGTLSMAMYRANKDQVGMLFVSLGFLGTGVLDAFHCAATLPDFIEWFPSSPESIITWSWHAPRTFLSVFVCLALWATSQRKIERRFAAEIACTMTVLLTIGSFLIFSFVRLPTGYFHGLLGPRPQEYVPGFFFSVALFGHLTRGRWRYDVLDHWITMSLFVAVAVHSIFMANSYALFDYMFNTAHLLKIVSYLFVAIGLTLAMNSLFRQADGAKLMALAVEYTQHGAVILNRDGNVEFANESFLRLIERSHDEVIGQNVISLFEYPESDNQSLEKIRRCFANGEGCEFELKAQKQNGSPLWIAVESRPVPADNGEVSKFISFLKDVTQRRIDEMERVRLQREAENQSAFLNTVLDSVSEGIVACNADGDIICANRSAEELLGLDEKQPATSDFKLFDANSQTLLTVEDGPLHRASLGAAIKNMEVEIKHDHRNIIATVNAAPLRTRDEIIGGVATFRDTTTERELNRNLTRFRKAIDFADDAMLTIEAQGQIVDVNSAACSRLEYERDELLGLSVGQLDPENARQSWQSSMWGNLLSKGSKGSNVFESAFQTKSGITYPVEVRTSRVEFDGEQLLLAFVRDITSKRKAEEEKLELTEELLHTSRQAGMAEVATGILHNVGNILNSVNVSAGVIQQQFDESAIETLSRVSSVIESEKHDLQSFLLSDKGQHFPQLLKQLAESLESEKANQIHELRGLVESVDHIKQIVAMQQSYARVHGVVEEIEIDAVIQQALRLHDVAFSRNNIAVSREGERGEVLTTERHKVLQIIVNLISNAKNAMQENQERTDHRLTIHVSSAQQGIQVRVTDTGIGISRENMKKLFSHGFTTRKDGHGFGLHSSTLTAQELGGSLSALSDGPGRGATFVLRLPNKKEEACQAK